MTTRLCACGCGKEAKRYMSNGRFKGWRAYAAGCAPQERIVIKDVTNVVDLSYAAGIIDGEGCIYARAYLDNKQGVFSTVVRVQVCMCSETIVKWLVDTFGGWCYSDVPKSGLFIHRRRFTWSIRGKYVLGFLRSIQPFLKEKKQWCMLALQLAEALSTETGYKKRLPESERARRIEIAGAIKAFNQAHRGEEEHVM